MQTLRHTSANGIKLCFSGDLTTHRSVIVLGRTQRAKKSDGIEKILHRFLALDYSIIWLDGLSEFEEMMNAVNTEYEKILSAPRLSNTQQKMLRKKASKRIIKLCLPLKRPSAWTASSLLALFNLIHPFDQSRIRLSANLRAIKLKKIEAALPNHELIVLSASSGCRASALPCHLHNIKAMICFGYPFKNTSIQHDQAWRTKPLVTVNKPFFIFQGDRDEYLNTEQAAGIPKSNHVALRSVQGTHDYSSLSNDEIDQVFETLAPFMSTH